MDEFEVKKWLLWNALQDLSVAALGAQQRKANSQPHFHICASRAQLLPGSEQRCDAAGSTIFTG